MPAHLGATKAFGIAFGVWLPLTYLALSLVPESATWGRKFLGAWWAFALIALGLLWVVAWADGRRWSGGLGARLPHVAVAGFSVAVTLLAADNGYRLWERWSGARHPGDLSADFDTRRLGLAVRRYYPTEKNFELYRPNVSVDGHRYGDLYSRRLLESAMVAGAVLTRHDVTFSIDRHGFRETTSRESARLFALGDSFTFGGLVRQEATWVKRLERLLGAPTYNLGVSAASPYQELLLLEHLLAGDEKPRIEHLLWMIFEGNDLEGSYETLRPATGRHSAAGSTRVSLAGWAASRLRGEVRERSLLHRALASGLDVAHQPPAVYYSARHGWKVFHPEYVERAALTRSYVETHPNRPHLERTFRSMKGLSERIGFRVTVLIAPTDARLYGPYFERFPPLSSAPHVIDEVEQIARSVGFSVVNLLPLLEPYAARELLYARDDTHWNERGHEVVASVIAEALPAR